jgi:uncharacterized protein involved in response to NO
MTICFSHQSSAPRINRGGGFINVFTAAPHRMMFLGGGIQFIVLILWWMIELMGRYLNLWPPLGTTIHTMYAHFYLAVYGLFPFFIFGFLMTVFPRWMAGEAVARWYYAGSCVLMFIGTSCFYIGLFAHKSLLLAGVAALSIGWITGTYALFRVYAKAKANDRTYETILCVALLAGLSGVVSYLAGFVLNHPASMLYSLHAGLWLFLIPILFTVAHRMIPFFSNIVIAGYEIYRPRWGLFAALTLMFGHFCIQIFGWKHWLFVVDLPLAVLAFHFSKAWSFGRSLQVRLLAMLHIAFLWLGIGTALYAIQSVWLIFEGQEILGRAPQHALGIGFMASMAVAFASRVSLGHSGRPLIADPLTWWCFIAVQAAAVLRVCAELPRIPLIAHDGLQLLASGIWIIGLTVWAARYLPIYLRPRLDGKPG